MTAEQRIEKEKRERTGYLDLGNCGLTEMPDLSGMDWLEALILANEWWDWGKQNWIFSQNKGSRNQLSAVPANCIPGRLKKLVLGGGSGQNWEIKDTRFLEKLTLLTTLSLRNNKISDGRFLENLTTLTTLDLRNNKINNGQFLENLTALTTLDVSYNQISDGRFLENLTTLTTLSLSFNQISDGSFLENLTALTILSLRYNKISNVQFLENLITLTTLDLSFNQISDGRFLENLTALTTLDLRNNKISDGRFLENLTALTTLDLCNNKISDGRFLENLTALTTLDLRHNKINDGSFLEKLTRLDSLSINGNPLKFPPNEVVRQGNPAILEYFRQKRKTGAAPLLEAKLILLGDGRAGKTTLANRLLEKPLPSEAERTLGVDINIGQYRFQLADDKEFVLHIWDFAGQDKYKPLHQFFYTEGAVYVMVADSGNANTDFDDWLQTAEMFGEDSPLVLTLNEFREGIGYGGFDPEHWQKRFPKLLKEVFLVNLKSGSVADLEHSIRLHAQSLPHTRQEYPKNWAAIRKVLEERREENFIGWQEYLKICRENELPEKESALILSGVLHKIGVCLHYQKSDLLRQHVILKNEWATEAVYKILEDRQVAEVKKGFFDWSDLRRIWSDEAWSEMRPQLLELMQQFKMAYPLPNGKEFVAPPMLPTGIEIGNLEIGKFGEDSGALELFIEYEFLPKALLTQFIVSRHTDIAEGRTLVWRNGVVLRWQDTLAEVSKTKSQGRDAFSVRVQGSDRKALLTAILKTFRDLHDEYKGIKTLEIMPCPCAGCRSGKNKQHFFEFENLKNRLERGRRVVECDKSLEEVDLVQLLGEHFVFQKLAVGQPVVMRETTPPVKAPLAFFSYSKTDVEYLKEFQKHLHTLRQAGKIQFWDDRKIRPGEEWDIEIKRALAQSDVVFLLVSVDFLNTDYIWKTEIAEAMNRHAAGEVKVIPIKIRACGWEGTPFSKLQGLPHKDKIIGDSPRNDAVWTEVVQEIGKELEGFSGR